MLDLAILISTVLLILGYAKIFQFHLLFILLTFGAFYWNFQAFAKRAILGFVISTSSLLGFVAMGTLAGDELVEIPMLTTILILVFVIARQRSEAEKQLRESNKSLESRVATRTKELSISREHYRRLTELSIEAILIHTNQRLLYINPAGIRLLGGKQTEELLGKRINDFIHPDYLDDSQAPIYQLSTELITEPLVEQRFIRLDGTSMDVEVLNMEIIYQGQQAILTVLRDITARKQIERARLAERTAIARDIHDSLGQNLGYLHLKLDQLVEGESFGLHDKMQAEFQRMRDVSAEAYQQVRHMLASLMPANTAEFAKALREQAKLLSKRGSFQVQMIERGESCSLNPLIQQQILFVCGEALTNIAKHANAKHVRVELKWSLEVLSIAIQDDGCGFVMSDPRSSFGLRIMSERMAQINGVFQIESMVNYGTTVYLQIPLAMTN